MTRLVALILSLVFALPAWAQSEKELDCRYQADVAAAVQKARLDGVKERDVAAAIAATNPTWPDRYSNAIPTMAGQFYQYKKRQLRQVDLGAQYFQLCMSQ